KTPAGTVPLTWKERIAALRNLPRLFRLVWQTSPSLMIGNGILRIARSAIPVAILYVGKLIIDDVVGLVRTGGPTNGLWQLVGLKFDQALESDELARATTMMDSLLGERIGNVTSIKIMQH